MAVYEIAIYSVILVNTVKTYKENGFDQLMEQPSIFSFPTEKSSSNNKKQYKNQYKNDPQLFPTTLHNTQIKWMVTAPL